MDVLALYLKRINRLFILAIFFIISGYHRARLMKRMSYLYRQGENCYFAIYNFGTEPWLISVGDNVFIASGVTFITHDVSVQMIERYLKNVRQFDGVGPIHIGNNVFIGTGTILLPGITVGDNVVIGAGSVIAKNIPSNVVVAGAPARVLRSFEDYVERLTERNGKLPWQHLLKDSRHNAAFIKQERIHYYMERTLRKE